MKLQSGQRNFLSFDFNSCLNVEWICAEPQELHDHRAVVHVNGAMQRCPRPRSICKYRNHSFRYFEVLIIIII